MVSARETWRSGSARGIPASLAAAGVALATIGNTAPNSHFLEDFLAEASASFSYADMFSRNAEVMRVDASHLKASDRMKRALAEEEGIRLEVYRDVAGYPTVGIGHLVLPQDDLQVGETITKKRAMDFLTHDLAKAEKAVARLLGDLPVYQHEFDALVDLVYNVGEGGVSEHRSPRLNEAVAQGDYDGIARELDYTSAGGATYRGLALRSERRAAIFEAADYENPRTA